MDAMKTAHELRGLDRFHSHCISEPQLDSDEIVLNRTKMKPSPRPQTSKSRVDFRRILVDEILSGRGPAKWRGNEKTKWGRWGDALAANQDRRRVELGIEDRGSAGRNTEILSE